MHHDDGGNITLKDYAVLKGLNSVIMSANGCKRIRSVKQLLNASSALIPKAPRPDSISCDI